MASLELKGIHKIYPGGVEAVKDFNMEIADKDLLHFSDLPVAVRQQLFV